MKALLIILLMASTRAQAIVTWDPVKILTACDMSLATCISDPVDLTNVVNYSIQAAWIGSPVGVIKLQVSNDMVPNCGAVTNWVDYTNSSQSISSSGNFLWNVTPTNYHCVRAYYTFTSGTGSLTVIYARK